MLKIIRFLNRILVSIINKFKILLNLIYFAISKFYLNYFKIINFTLYFILTILSYVFIRDLTIFSAI